MSDYSKILVIGGEGFIGSSLVRRLVREGKDVFSLDNHLSSGHRERIKNVKYIFNNSNFISSLKEKFDCVVHLGEYARVERSVTQPKICFQNNFGPIAEILEYCRCHEVKLIYGGSSTKFMDDKHKFETPYSFTKRVNSELVNLYGQWYNLKYAICYFYNVYGPDEISSGEYSTLIGKCSKSLKYSEKIEVHGSGEQLRNFTHIEDTVDALLLLIETGFGDGYCIAAEQAHSVLDVIHKFGLEYQHVSDPMGNRRSAMYDNKKIKDLGWVQKHTLVDYIEKLKNGDR